MSWHLVDGVPLPDPVGGHPALDFCNTRAGWSTPVGGQPKEYLTSPRALVLWAADAGLLPPGASVADGEQALARALALRDSLYACLLHRGTARDWSRVSLEAAAARAASTLRPGDDGRARWHLDPATPAALAALHAAAGAAEELAVSALAATVGVCPGDGCGWLFADPRRRRRWCSMAVCGNRAKARRYAARHDPEAARQRQGRL